MNKTEKLKLHLAKMLKKRYETENYIRILNRKQKQITAKSKELKEILCSLKMQIETIQNKIDDSGKPIEISSDSD